MDLIEGPGLTHGLHDTSDEEVGEILERIGRAADGLADAAPAP
ncbi:hypothetical protein WME91_38795 [Sorangium sp. So ce269]